MIPSDLSSIERLSAALEDRSISAVELLEGVLRSIEAWEPHLNCFAHLDAEGARDAAVDAERRQMRGERLGPLDGIPTSVKDLIAQKGLPLRFGSRVSDPAPCPVDAPVVERLRRAGAVLLGKSTTSEFGCKAVGSSPLTGITRNPWNTAMTPGGSSAGAAAMVAAGIVPFAIGTDGGGSLRIPAALSGVFGFKPQFGRVPVHPVSATPTLAHVGPIAASVSDAATVLGVISGYDRCDPFSVAGPVPDFQAAACAERPLRIAWSPTLGYARPSPDVLRLTRDAALRLELMGHHVEEVAAPMTDPADLWAAEFYAGVGTKLAQALADRPDELDPSVLALLRGAQGQDVTGYHRAVFERYAFRDTMRRFFERYDLLVSPTLPVDGLSADANVPEGLEERNIVSWVFYTYPFNLTGQPAASLPVGLSASGLPVGLQVVGRLNDEASVLGLCAAYERRYGDTGQKPVQPSKERPAGRKH